jgi:hypothetical protein
LKVQLPLYLKRYPNESSTARQFYLLKACKICSTKNNFYWFFEELMAAKVNPCQKGRIFDLTRVVAPKTGVFDLGIGKVLVQKVEKPPNK